MERDDWTSVGYESDQTVGQVRAPLAPISPVRPLPISPSLTRTIFGPTSQGPATAPSVSEQRIREIAREEAASATRPVAERVEELRRQATLGEYRAPDAWREEELLYVIGFDRAILDQSHPTATIVAQPQRAFRGERLVVDVRRSTGAEDIAVSITGFRVGQASQFVGAGAVPAETFAASAFGVRLGLTPAAPGIFIALDFSAPGIPSGKQIIVTAALIGRVRRDG